MGTRTFLLRLLLALIIVVPSTVLLQRSIADHAATRAVAKTQRSISDNQQSLAKNQLALAKNQQEIAAERVARRLAECQAFNEQRAAYIATSEAVLQVVGESQPFMSDEERLQVTAFVQRASRAAERATKPKVCTIKALHLQDLAGIADRHP